MLLKEKPKHDPKEYIQRNIQKIRIYNIDNLPVEVISIFESVFYLIDLCSILKEELDDKIKNDVVKFIINFKNDDNGFGHPNSTLIDTSHALSTLNWLNYPIDLLETKRFVKACENPIFGFANIPNTEPSFIEHIHAGVIASTLLAYKPSYLNQCIKFIRGCQNSNGGFARSSLGISTLENTYYAIKSLLLLLELKNM